MGDIEHLYVFLALALLSEILGTIGGFGSSLFFVPIAGYFLDFHSVLGITAVFHVTSNFTKIVMFRKGLDRALIIRFGIPAVLFVMLGAWLSKYIDSGKLEIVLGCLLIVLSVVLFYFRKRTMKQSGFNTVSGGVISGFAAGLLGTGGAIRGIFLSAWNLNMESFIATSAVIDMAIDLSRSLVYALNGYVHRNDMYLIPFLFLISLAGTYIGKRILKFVSEQQFRMIVIVFILITGIFTVYKFVFQTG